MIDSVYADLNAALKAGDKKTASALRLLYSSLKNAQIDLRDGFNDDEATKVVKKEIKKRVEARDMYAQHGRDEQAAQEEFERSLYSQYAPAELGVDKIDELIAQVVAPLTPPLTFAMIMPAVMKAAQGQADGRLVSDRVKAFLAKE